MQFKVPQFLEIEDKIFGPFTFKEFVYLAGGAGLCFVLYKLLGFYLGAVPILAAGGLSLALTFYRPNNKPFINMVEAGFSYFTKNKLYIWKRRPSSRANLPAGEAGLAAGQAKIEPSYITKLTGNKLRDLAWSLDLLDLNKHENN